MSKTAKITRYLYMLDDFQRDVTRQAKKDGQLCPETVGSSLLMISVATRQAIEDATGDRIDMEHLVVDLSEMLWHAARIAECAGVQLSDVAGYAVDQHDEQPDRRVM